MGLLYQIINTLESAKNKVVDSATQFFDTDQSGDIGVKEAVVGGAKIAGKAFVETNKIAGKAIIETGKFTNTIVKETLQAIPRGVVSAGIQPAADSISLATGKEIRAEYTPTKPIEKFALGDRPIVGFGTKAVKAQQKTTSFLERMGVSPALSTSAGLIFAPLAIGGSMVLDATPLAGFEKNVGKQAIKIAGTKDILKITSHLDELIKGGSKLKSDLAERLKDISNKEEVNKILFETFEILKQSPIDRVEALEPFIAKADEAAKVVKKQVVEALQTGEKILDDVAGKIKYGKLTQEGETLFERMRRAPLAAQEALVNRHAPLDRMQKNVLKSAKLDQPNLKLSEQAEQLAGIQGQQMMNTIRFEEEVVEPVKDVYKEFVQYVALRRNLTRVKAGKKTGAYTEDQMKQGLEALSRRVGSEKFARIEEAGTALQRKTESALNYLKAQGVLSDKAIKKINDTYDFYAKYDVIHHVGDEIENAYKQGRGIKIKQSEILKRLEGIKNEDFELFDPVASTASQFARIVALGKKNGFMRNNIAPLADLDEGGKWIKRINTADLIKTKMSFKSALKDSKPLKANYEKWIKQNSKTLRKIFSEKNKLEKSGLKETLKQKRDVVEPTFPKKKITIEIKKPFLKDARPKTFKELSESFGILRRDKLNIGIIKKEFGSYELFENEVLMSGWQQLVDIGIDRKTARAVAEKIFKKPKRFGYDIKISEKGSTILKSNKVQKFIDDLIVNPTLPTGELRRLGRSIGLREQKIKEIAQDLQNLRVGYKNLKEKRTAQLIELKGAEALEALAKKQADETGMEIFKYFDEGEEVMIAIEKDAARALSGLNTEMQLGVVGEVLNVSRSIQRFGVITTNVGFQLANFFLADMPRNLIQNKYYGLKPTEIMRFVPDYIEGFLASASLYVPGIRPSKLIREFMDSGAANATYSRMISPESFAGRKGQSLTRRILSAPLDVAAKFGDVVETTSKVAGFKTGSRAYKRGEATMEEIVREVRNFAGSPDFARRGSKTGDWNLLFMFFNARMQGISADLKRLNPKNPDSRQAWVKLTSGVGLPTTALSLNHLKPENKEDWERVSDEEKKNYFMIEKSLLYGMDNKKSYFVNERGERVRDYWKIQKREVIKLLANPIEDIVSFIHYKDPKHIEHLFTGLVEGVSPINIEGGTIKERGLSVLSGTNPLVKVPAELLFGKSTFTRQPIIPEYINGRRSAEVMKEAPWEVYKKTTNPIYIEIGRRLKMSPLILEHAINGLSGGFSEYFAPRIRGQEGSREAIGPIQRRFERSPFTQPTIKEQEELDRASAVKSEYSVEKINASREAEKAINDLWNVKTQKEVKDIIYNLSPEAEKEFVKIMEERALNLNYTDDQLKKIQSNEEKARYVVRAMNNFKTQKDALDFFARMDRLGFITSDVEEKIKVILGQ